MIALTAVAATTALVAVGVSSQAVAAGCKSGFAIGYMGPLTGPYAAYGAYMAGGTNLAVQEFNKANPNCKVTFIKLDDKGSASQIAPIAAKLIQNKKVLGIMGPGFSTEVSAVEKAFNQAGLLTVSPSATNPTLTAQGWKVFKRVVASDASQGPAAARYMKNTLKAKRIFLIDDAEVYGQGLCSSVGKSIPKLISGTDRIQQKQTDFSATVQKVIANKPDAVYFCGFYQEGGLIVKQLRQAGYKGAIGSDDGSFDPSIIKVGGTDATNGMFITYPGQLPTAAFAKAYKAANKGQTAGAYAPESYDAANVTLAAIKSGATTRAQVLAFANKYKAKGVTKTISFTAKGEVASKTIYVYKIAKGAISPNPLAVN